MSSAFDQQFLDSGFPELLEHFGEPVLFHSAESSDGVEINAIVKRDGLVQYEVNRNLITPRAVAVIANDSELGVLATDLDRGTNYVSLSLVVGGPQKKLKVSAYFVKSGNKIELVLT